MRCAITAQKLALAIAEGCKKRIGNRPEKRITQKFMCTSPIHIYTNARYLGSVCKYTLTVPCGKCEECKNMLRNQYLVRSFYESLKVKRFGGVGLFDTLTYRPEDVPTRFGIKCFNYQDIVNFKKKLKINITRDGFDATKISYLIASEYGDKTARPHYHLELYAWFKGATVHYLHDVVSRSWSFGFTDKKIKQIPLNGSGLGAMSYVTKYVAKSFGDNESLDIALKQGMKNLTEEQIKQIFENYADCFKIKHFQSIGYGDYLLTMLANKEKLFNVDLNDIFFNKSAVLLPDKANIYKLYPLGHYYVYKTFFDRVYNPITGKCDQYRLNEIGKAWKIKNLIIARDRFIDRFQEYRPHMIALLNQTLSGSSTINPLWQTIKDALLSNRVDVKSFAEYALFYRSCSWLRSQYCPFEMWSFEKDLEKVLFADATIENHCYTKKFIDENGNVVEKPYSRQFRETLLSRRFDVVSNLYIDQINELLYDLYCVVDAERFRHVRQSKNDDKAKDARLLRQTRLITENITNR